MSDKTTLIIDASHHSMRIISICKQQETAEEGYGLWRYYFVNGIFKFIDEFKADEVILTIDSRTNWRKDIFPWYKGHRKLLREKEDDTQEAESGWFNFTEYFSNLKTFTQDIKTNLPFKVIEVDRAEGDDVIGVLSTTLPSDKIVIVSVDGDFKQLLKNPKVKLYSPIRKDFITSDDPKKELIVKAIMGDKGDFIPSIADKHNFKPEFIEYCLKELNLAQNETNLKVKLDNDETLMYNSYFSFMEKYGITPSKVRRFSEKEAIGLINTDTLNEMLMKDENKSLKKRFIRNNKLVNLTEQPQDIKDSIIKAYTEYSLPNLTGLFNFCKNNKFRGFMEDFNNVTSLLQKLK